jgi:hypothetical protein
MKSSIKPRKPRKNDNRAAAMDLAPDGLRMVVDWKTFEPGSSVFVPCIDMVEAVSQFYEVVQHKGWVCDHRCRVENKMQGVRFWRIA